MAGIACTGDTQVIHHSIGEVGELGCRVAGLARQRGRQVVAWLGYWSHTKEHLAVMTGVAPIDDAGMVHHTRSRRSRSRAGRVTQCTGLCRRQMA